MRKWLSANFTLAVRPTGGARQRGRASRAVDPRDLPEESAIELEGHFKGALDVCGALKSNIVDFHKR